MTENEIKESAKIIIEYIDKYVKKNDECYEKLLKLTNLPILQNEFSDQEWYFILESAWKIAYTNAMKDNNITYQEKVELNKINTLGLQYKNKTKNSFEIKSQVINNLHAIRQVNQYETPIKKSIYEFPKLTPDYNSYEVELPLH